MPTEGTGLSRTIRQRPRDVNATAVESVYHLEQSGVSRVPVHATHRGSSPETPISHSFRRIGILAENPMLADSLNVNLASPP
jgi:hypothetical protein